MPRCAVVLLFAGALFAAPPFTREWSRRLGPPAPTSFYSAAVCPGGTLYLADGRGSVTAVGPAGDIVSRRTGIAELARGRLLTCDERGRLYVTRISGLAVLEPRPGDWTVAGRLASTLRPVDAAPASGGRVYVLGVGPASRLPLHTLDAAGNLRKSFGEPLPGYLVPRPAPEGCILWDGARLLHIPRYGGEIRVYDREGRLLRIVNREPPSHIVPVQAGDGGATEVLGAALLPGGRLLLQTRRFSRYERGSATSLEIYGPGLDIERSGIESPEGLLAGADRDGGAYFASIAPREILIEKLATRSGRLRLTRGRPPSH